MITQPIKVILLAVVAALIFKTLEESDRDEREREKPERYYQMSEEDRALYDITRQELGNLGIPLPVEGAQKRTCIESRERSKNSGTFVKEFLLILLFFLLVSLIAWGSTKGDAFNTNNNLYSMFDMDSVRSGQLLPVSTLSEFYEWLRNRAIPSLYYEETYTNQPTILRDRLYMSDMVSFRVGLPRLRQLRLKPDTCKVHPIFQPIIAGCKSGYHLLNEETRDFTIGWRLAPLANQSNDDVVNSDDEIGKAFEYQSMAVLKNAPYVGQLATYGGGGYLVNFGNFSSLALQLVDQLISHQWIDQLTAAVFFEVAVFNPNVNLFSYVCYLLEFPPSGGIIANRTVSNFYVFKGVQSADTIVLIAQIVYLLVLVYFIVGELILFHQQGRQYFCDVGHLLQLAIILLSFVAIGFFALKELQCRAVFDQLQANNEAYNSFLSLAVYSGAYDYAVAFIVFCAYVRFLKLLRYNRDIAVFLSTLRCIKGDLLSYVVLVVVLLMAFVAWGYESFGSTSYGYRSVASTVEALFVMTAGQIRFASLAATHRVEAEVFFFLLSCLIILIVVNLLIAILYDAYSQVRRNDYLIGEDFKIVDHLLKKLARLAGEKDAEAKKVQYLEPTDSIGLRLDNLNRRLAEQCRDMLGMTAGVRPNKKLPIGANNE